MFAQVVPLTRLPRRFTFFDYQIPPVLSVEVGDLVTMPFKGRLVNGIVIRTTSVTQFKNLASISQIQKKFLMSLNDIERLQTIAFNITQSPASVLHAALRGIEAKYPKPLSVNRSQRELSVDPETAAEVGQALKLASTAGDYFVQTSLEGSIAFIKKLTASSTDQILILTPTERDAEHASQLLAVSHSAVLHGHTKPAVRATIINQWRGGQIRVLIGTRQASLLPANQIGLIFVTQSSSDDYRITDRNPRFDVRLAAGLLAAQHRARLVHIDHFPRVENLNVLPTATNSVRSAPFCVIDLNDKQEWSGEPMISETLLQAIRDACQNGQKVLCSYNRKGVAKRLQCADCGHLPKCGTCGNLPTIRLTDLICQVCHTEMWPPKTCPACGSSKLKNQGLGNEKIADGLRRLLPEVSVGLMEKGRPLPDTQVTIATEFYFAAIHEPFARKQFGLVAELCFDHHLAGDFRAREAAARKLWRLNHLARQQRAQCLIQTWSPGEITLMLETKKFLDDELALRRRYRLPPAYDEIHGQITEKAGRAIILNNLRQLPDSEIIQTDIDSYVAPSTDPAK
jgi:primosomal protein N'